MEKKMKIRAELRLKNGLLIELREKMGFSQAQLAESCGVSQHFICRLENLKYTPKSYTPAFIRVCDFLGVCHADILPEDILGKEINTVFRKNIEVQSLALQEYCNNYGNRMTLPSPSEEMLVVDQVDFIKDIIDKKLTFREKTVISERFGISDGKPKTLAEIGKRFKVSRNRVRQIEAKAIRKIKHETEVRHRKEGLQ
jgi:RNA polymerase sigma factor (sigma-70 family)